MVDVVSDVIINYKSVGLDKVGSDIKQTSVALDGLVVSATSSEKATASLENRFKSLERQFSTTEGNAEKFAKVQDSVNKAVAQNPELQGRANEVLAAAAAKYGMVDKAVNDLADAHKGLDAQGQAALHSMRSMAEQLALGSSPVQALTAQMNHLTFAASGEGGIAGAFKQAAGVITGMITPMRLAGAGAIALGAGAVIAANDWLDAQDKIQTALIGIGARTGTTADQVNQFAQKNASATGLSVSQMRDVGTAFAKTGNIVISQIEGVGDAVHGYSILTGKTATEATKDLAQALGGDLVKGAEELNKTYGFLNPAIEENIRQMQRNGDRAGATQVILNAMSADNLKAADNLGILTKAWNAVANAAAAAKNAIGAAVAAGPSDEQPGLIMLPRGMDPAAAARQAKQMADAAAAGADAWTKASNAIAMGADQVVKAAVPEIGQLEKVKDALAAIDRQRQAASGVGPFGPTQPTTFDDHGATQALKNQEQLLEQSIEASQRYNQRVAEIASRWTGVGQAVALQLQAMQNHLPVIEAVTGQQKMAAQYAADYANAIDAGKTGLEASALAAAKLEAAQAAATASVMQQVASLKDSTAMIIARQNGTEATTAAAIAYKNAIQSGADATAAAALKAETLKNYMAQAGNYAQSFEQYMLGANDALNNFNAGMGQSLLQAQTAAAAGGQDTNVYTGRTGSNFAQPGFTPRGGGGGGGDFTANPNFPTFYAGGGTGRRLSVATDYAAADQQYLDFLGIKSPAQARAEAAQKAQDALKNSVDNLTKSTDSLNATNQELLSPYYTQDPRTSHIGFRSQGMAAGGYIDVPGGVSSNDNMIATVPVASGERIYIDPMNNRRSTSSGSGTVINISSPINIYGNADKDQFGRTVFQANQQLAKSVRAATQ
jgi:hypothetical protein